MLLVLSSALLAAEQRHALSVAVPDIHYTSCLLNARPGTFQLPTFVTRPRLLTAKGSSASYYVLVFENAKFDGDAASGVPATTELCFSVLGDSPHPALGGRGGIQEARCYGSVPLASWDHLSHEVHISLRGPTGAEGADRAVTAHLNGSFLYRQATGSILGSRIDELSLGPTETVHTHNSLAGHGYVGRVFTKESYTFQAVAARVELDEVRYNQLFDANISTSDLHDCFTVERLFSGGSSTAAVRLTGLFDDAVPQSEFTASLDDARLDSALELSTKADSNLEELFWQRYKLLVDPPAVLQPSYAFVVRSVSMVLDLLYPFFVTAQRRLAGAFPSNRFNKMRIPIWVHFLSGSVVLYTGVALHVADLSAGNLHGTGASAGFSWTRVTQTEDEAADSWRRPIYYAMAVATLIHCCTVYNVLPKVMGEKRITIPLYFCAGMVNLWNAIRLLANPNLHNAFLVWGSVNTFIYVRWQVFLLCFSYIDWELIYTYGILAAAFVSYPLSMQSEWIFLMLAAPCIYGPFHERICGWFGWYVEDEIGGNKPNKDKNMKMQGNTLQIAHVISEKRDTVIDAISETTDSIMEVVVKEKVIVQEKGIVHSIVEKENAVMRFMHSMLIVHIKQSLQNLFMAFNVDLDDPKHGSLAKSVGERSKASADEVEGRPIRLGRAEMRWYTHHPEFVKSLSTTRRRSVGRSQSMNALPEMTPATTDKL